MEFKLKSLFKPTGDQPQAIKQLVEGFFKNQKFQTLLGVTGSGKTFTMANVIAEVQKPTLIISHNKTLAAQLASEFQQFFPENAVHYFVSYYDYYQPEAYILKTDTYIAKEATINEEIERLRHAATSSLLTRRDVIIVASVSCLYGIGSPQDYDFLSVEIKKGDTWVPEKLVRVLSAAQYQRNDYDFFRGKIRVRGEVVDVFPPYSETYFRIRFWGNLVEEISENDYLTGKKIAVLDGVKIYPAKHWVTPEEKLKKAIEAIREELEERVAYFKKEGKLLEAERIYQRTMFDLEMLQETGYCSGIENYSRHLEGRAPGEPPFSLIDYFPSDYLIFIDESHMTIPQIRAMAEGDRARKKSLIDYGFRLPSAYDNRPLNFDEFLKRINQAIFVSATPGSFELSQSTGGKITHIYQLSSGQKVENIAQQLIRPTGILDPEIEVKSMENFTQDLILQIKERVAKKQRVLVTTLTKRMAEDLAEFLKGEGIKVHYLHSEIETLKRIDILTKLRKGVYDVLVGINLLREGLDLPEVSLVAIIDADKEGYLRSETALIQVMGRAARHKEGKVIMYADRISKAMEVAIKETQRRRAIQEEYNRKYNIIPQTVQKEIYDILEEEIIAEEKEKLKAVEIQKIPNLELKHLINVLENEMEIYAQNLEFEKAAVVRDQIIELKKELDLRKIK